MVALGCLLMLIIIAVPDAGLYVLAVAIPVSQTSFGTRLITNTDLLILLAACVLGRVSAGRVTLPPARTVGIGLTLVCYFTLSLVVVGGGVPSGQGIRGPLVLGSAFLSLPVIARADAVTRHATIVFAFATACAALIEIPTSRASVANSGNILATNSAALAADQTGALNHNTMGGLFILALCVLLASYSRLRRQIARFATVAAIAALVAGIAYSFSRSSYFGTLSVLTVFAIRRPASRLLISVVAAGCTIPLLPPAVSARIGSVWSGGGLDPSSVGRLDLWRAALQMFIHHPIFGVGYLHFTSQLPAYFQNTSSSYIPIYGFSGILYAHNLFLTLLSQAGLIGVVLVGALVMMRLA